MVVRWCTIANNFAYQSGGGVNITYSGIIENCVIVSNWQTRASAGRGGSGVFFYDGTNAFLRNCLVAYNSNALYKGAVHCAKAGNIENCTIVSNSYYGLLVESGGRGAAVANTIIYSNTALDVAGTNYIVASNCLSSVALTGTDNRIGDPAFANPAGDFRLTAVSPCVNKGLNLEWMDGTRDVLGNRRILERVVDIGAYEFVRRGAIISGR